MEQSRRRRPCCVGCVGVLVLSLVPMWFYVFSHDWNLWRLGRQFGRLSHPSGTHVVENKRELGLLIANSNHIDYFVGQLRSYTGPRERVLAYYRGKTVWNPISKRRQAVEVVFVAGFVRGDMVDLAWPFPVVDMVDRWKKRRSGDGLYIVYVFDPGYPCGLDLRGC